LSSNPPKVLKSKLFWVGVLYFAEGFPLGVFFELFPVHFRQQGVELRQIGALSLLGLAWTLKFLWAPAIDHFRHHRRWMAAADLGMGAVMVAFAMANGLPPWVWAAIAAFAVLSATNDVAIDGYTIELLDKQELGFANGIRIGLYRVGMLAAGGVLILVDIVGWNGAYLCAAGILVLCAAACLAAPREAPFTGERLPLRQELVQVAANPWSFAIVLGFVLGCLWLIDSVAQFSRNTPWLWQAIVVAALLIWAAVPPLVRAVRAAGARTPAPSAQPDASEASGPLFGAVLELARRPGIVPVIAFILTFKLADAAMGFMVKPFWVDSGFKATEIGLVSVNIGLVLSIAGGLAGGWYADRAGIFRALWVLGLAQALSNLGYALAAGSVPHDPTGASLTAAHRAIVYAASGFESFTGGLGTAAFLAFLMSITDKRRAATEYALLSSVFALSRSVAGWAGGFGAEQMGFAGYFLFTFFLAFPAYCFLPWVRRMLEASTGATPATEKPA
jgi:PAT family beta-lactamase induction signal transducer AmpG